MKKLLTLATVLLTAALFFTGCSNAANSGDSNGTAPSLDYAFFVPYTDSNPYATFEEAQAAEIKTISFTNKAALVIAVKEPDLDFKKLFISPTEDFEHYIYWNWNSSPTNADFYSWCTLSTVNLSDATMNSFVGTNKTIYVKAMDSKGNYSNIKTITGLKITR